MTREEESVAGMQDESKDQIWAPAWLHEKKSVSAADSWHVVWSCPSLMLSASDSLSITTLVPERKRQNAHEKLKK